MTKHNKKNGFTLIELLVVVAIISMLSGIIISSLTTARQRANDTARKTELVQLRTAIAHYFTENGSYPNTSGVWLSSENGDSAAGGPYTSDWVPGLVAAKMIPALPKDPVGGVNPSCPNNQYRAYLYRSDGVNYKLISNCALQQASSYQNDQFYDPKRSTPSPAWAIQITSDTNTTATW